MDIAKLNHRDLVKSVTLTVRIESSRLHRISFAMGAWFVKAGCKLMGMRHKVVIEIKPK